MLSFPPELNAIFSHLQAHGITPIVVGGYVRDALLGHSSKDIDIELYGNATYDELVALLNRFGKLNLIGKSFGVLKLTCENFQIDFAPPRSESKSGFGHKGFDIFLHADLSFDQAARRRDFTINAIGYNPLTHTLLDPYNGQIDLANKRLVCVNPDTFIDDPLRVLRAIQFAARFELQCDPLLFELCQRMISQGLLSELPKERVFEEVKKLLIKSPRPSIGFELLREMGGLILFPELERFITTPQDPASHPEGSVWIHTMMAIDTMASYRTGDEKCDLIRMLAVLLHDIGKPDTTIMENGIFNAPKHAEVGVPLAETFLERLSDEKMIRERVLPLVHYHGVPRKLYASRASDGDIRRLSTKVIIDDLIIVAKADYFGRYFNGNLPERYEAGEWVYERAKELGVLYSPPPSLLMGKDLITMGMIPSAEFSTLLAEAYAAQLEGDFLTKESALLWLKKRLNEA